MKIHTSLAFIVFLVSSNFSFAEIYKDFTPHISLKEIKNNYPNAKFDDLKPAWAKANESFLSLYGSGIIGKIYLKLSHIDELHERLLNNPEVTENQKNYSTNALNRPLDERLTLDWLRWIPSEDIPMERLVSRYGKPEKCDYNEESFRPYCSWESKGIVANLSDDKKIVYNIEFYFTEQDYGLDKKVAPTSEKPKESSSKKKKL